LFHWIDSLAGTSGGKTVPAHRRHYQARLGEPTAEETRLLQRFERARLRDANRDPLGLSGLRRTFLETNDLVAALDAAEVEMTAENFDAIRDALEQFGPKYEVVWQDGRIPLRFLERFAGDPKRHELEALLLAISRFFATDLSALPRPAVVLAPVPSGYGTHAAAVGPYLLIEIRPSDHLAEQASVIVHENSHFLFVNMDPARRARIEAVVKAHGSRGASAWTVMNEALPTALGQGVADSMFRPRTWSVRNSWYHTTETDTYAKAIYSLVEDALASERTMDEAFVEKAIALFPY
jgi:hypothetical protein